MSKPKFFEERRDQSEVKARIVEKYFLAWSKIIRGAAKKGSGRIAYIDLYAGPGRYKDGSVSTPLMVLDKAADDAELADMLVTIFNDENGDHSNTLISEIKKNLKFKNLKYPPQVTNQVVDDHLRKAFADLNLVPTFSFFDPFGYKGLSLGLIHAFIKNWGCDTVFFFNYNRINAGISNAAVMQHMSSLFGATKVPTIQARLSGASPDQRAAILLEEISLSLKALGGKYVLPFRFNNATGTRLSHCLIFVSKHPKGYALMKEIMAGESSTSDQGVPSFVYSPADASTPLLFSLSQPLTALKGMLESDFKGMTKSMIDLYNAHHIDRPYIKANYKAALIELEEAGKIVCIPPASHRPRRAGKATFADDVIVKFPK